MKRKQILLIAIGLIAGVSGLTARAQWIENWQIDPDKKVNSFQVREFANQLAISFLPVAQFLRA